MISTSWRYSGRPKETNANFHYFRKPKRLNAELHNNNGSVFTINFLARTFSWKVLRNEKWNKICKLCNQLFTLENSSSGICNFFLIRSLTSDRVSPKWITKKKGSPKFWICFKFVKFKAPWILKFNKRIKQFVHSHLFQQRFIETILTIWFCDESLVKW